MTNLTEISRTAEKYHLLKGYLWHACESQQHKLSQKREPILHYETICVNNKKKKTAQIITKQILFNLIYKHKTLICMHAATYYGCSEFKFQKTDTSLINKVAECYST
jgi:hypothetical protein